jgi:colanic acid/amylovoran biosynthesis protein
VLVRDGRSRRHLEEVGVPSGRLHVVPDAAFALAEPERWDSAPAPGPPRRVAVSVRAWQHFGDGSGVGGEDRYLCGVAGLVRWLVERVGAEVTFLSSCQGIADYWTDDAATADRVVAHLPPNMAARVRVDREFRGPDALQRTLGDFDLVVATRMHVAILALCAGRPVLPIAYEFKTTELFESLGAPWLTTPIEAAESEDLVGRAERLLAEWSATCELLATGVRRLVAALDAVPPLMEQAFASRAGSGVGGRAAVEPVRVAPAAP